MVGRAVTRTRGDGQPQYARSIRAVTDTAAPDAQLRNAITLSAEVVVVLSAPATWLARSLALAGTPAQYRQRVKRVVIVDAGDLERDRTALDALTAALPSPPIVCAREIGDALKVPESRLTGAFTWAGANPVADALTTSADAPVALHDVAALHYALYPDAGFFSLAAGRLAIDPASTDQCRDALVALATAKPAPPPTGRGGK
jgi:hypothetical protein